MKVFRRSLFAWIALLGIIFSQLAVSAYACPLQNPANAPAQMESKDDMAGMPCAEMDMAVNVEQPALCAQHCDQGKQAVGSTPAPDFQPALVLPLIVPMPSLAEAPGETYVQAPLLARSTSPPPFWRSARLRI